MNAEDVRTGLLCLCGITMTPMLLGGLFAWWLRGRVMEYGFPGGLLPDRLRERWRI